MHPAWLGPSPSANAPKPLALAPPWLDLSCAPHQLRHSTRGALHGITLDGRAPLRHFLKGVDILAEHPLRFA